MEGVFPMTIPQEIRQTVEGKLGSYIEHRIPEHVRDEVRLKYKVRGNSVTLSEERPVFWKPDLWVGIKVAQFRFDPIGGKWTLYWADRNSKWHEYYDLAPSEDFQHLLEEVEEDPTGIFWG